MALFYNSGSTPTDSGKFRPRRRLGIQHDGQHRHDGYRFELLSMESTVPVRRMRYHVRISNSRNIRVAYLRNFTSAHQALATAKDWVAEHQTARREGA